ncbi:MAG: HU family DNA-binding protein [Bryobacteraceae bacterium]|jgi:nucleoid DNA-binding protein
MRKPEIARRVARKSGVSDGEAADRLDHIVCEILSRLRHGKDASLPGLGRFTSGPDGRVSFEREGSQSHD